MVRSRESALTPQPPLPQGGRGGATDKEEDGRLPGASSVMKRAAQAQRKSPTKSEAVLWDALRNRGLEGCKFRRQQAIGRFIVDFYCHELKLAVEIDGPIHASQKEADAERQRSIESQGIRFVRVSAQQVEDDLSAVLDIIRTALQLPSPSGRGVGGEG